MAHPLVVLDLAAGRALLGGAIVSVRARPGGALEFRGRVIRPLRFGERWRLIDEVTATEGADGTLGASVLAVAAEGVDGPDGAGPDDEAIARVLALHLAGGRTDRTVPGCSAQLAALVAAGWSPREVLDTDADLVDLLTSATDLGERVGDDGWTSIVLADAAADSPADGDGQVSLGELLRMLERDLLGRLAPALAESVGFDVSAGHVDADGRVRGSLAAVAAAFGPRAVSAALEEQRAGSTAASPGTHAADRPAGPFPAAEPARTAASSEPFAEPTVVGPKIGQAAWPRLPAPIRIDWAGGRLSNDSGAAPSVFGVPSVRDDRAIPASAVLPIAQPTVAPGEPFVRRATRADAPAAPVVVHDDAAASRTDRLAFPAPVRPDAFDVADEIATLLDEESDLRGLRR